MSTPASSGGSCLRTVRSALLALLLAGSASVRAGTVHVDDSPNPCSPKDGSLACPYLTIQEAVTAAAVGDQVLVLPGHYCGQVPGDPVVFMKNGVDVVSELGPDVTTIDAGGGGGVCPDQDFAAVRFSNTSPTSTLVTTLSGFTITGGKGRPRTAAQRDQAGGARSGGGIFIFNTNNAVVTPIIENNIITGNVLHTADVLNFPLLLGGGIYVTVGRPLITSNTITGNSAADPSGLYGYGGAIYGANYSRPMVTNNIISGNSAADQGGAILFKTLPFSTPATLDGNVIEGNTADIGGAILAGANSEITITNNLIQGNDAAVRGGAMETYYSSIDVRNNTIVDNTGGRTGGIFLGASDDRCKLDINTSCTTNADCPDPGDACFFQVIGISNNIISGNDAAFAEFASGIHLLASNTAAFTFTYNNLVDNLPADFGGGMPDPFVSPGDMNISTTPIFVQPGTGDYHLAQGSPEIDAGSNALAPPTDLDGISRPRDGDGDLVAVADMGAYEFVSGSDDPDGDGISSDGDLSGVAGDAPCTGGVITNCDDNCAATPNPGQEDLDGDGMGDVCDPDDDGDGYLDEDETTNCSPPSDPADPASVPVDTDADLLCDTIDTDDDNDEYSDIDETTNCTPASNPLDPVSIPLDTDGDLDCNTLDLDDDNDGWLDDEETVLCIPPSDPLNPASVPVDTDGDFFCDTVDIDDDNDSVLDGDDIAPLDPTRCQDLDFDTCDDCSQGLGAQPANDGLDTDGDGLCNDGDPDIDNDGAENEFDCAPLINSIDQPPAEVPLFLTLDSGGTLSWPTGRQSNISNVYRMILTAGVPFSHDFACAMAHVPENQWTDADTPSLGELQSYLVSAVSICGEGVLGFDSSGMPIPTPAPACVGGGNDSDGDLVPDLDDNCPLAPNSGQEDQDIDGLGDLCDACPSQPPLAGIGSSLALLADLETLVWSPDPQADDYEVFRARVHSGAPIVPNYSCFDQVVATTSVDATIPGSGEVLCYLVRSRKACDTSSPGVDAQGNPRPFRGACLAP